MALTPQMALRDRIAVVLAGQPGGTASRADVLAEMNRRFRGSWTADDLTSPRTRPFETKWENRASYERARMVRDGLLRDDADGNWSLTDAGAFMAADLVRRSVVGRDAEEARREGMWSRLREMGGPRDIEARAVNDLRIFRGGRGVYADGDNTRAELASEGATVALLHNGSSYADELSASGVRYHYPRTAVPGRDRAEIEATKESYRQGLPVFVVTTGKSASFRTVHRGYVEDYDDRLELFLITFTDYELPPPPPADEESPFALTGPQAALTYGARRSRPNQQRFAFAVFRRYGESCAVCGLAISQVLHAAHLRAKKDSGSDDARNGLPLCANHHIALDVGLWGIDPTTTALVATPGGPTLEELGITKPDLSHLPAFPHEDAMTYLWESQGNAPVVLSK